MSSLSLSHRLKKSIEAMGIDRLKLGHPELVEHEVKRAETLFKDFSKAKPSTQDAYNAALRLLNGNALDNWSTDLVAAAVCIPITEKNGVTVLESQYFDTLLHKYESEAKEGNLWRLTWYSLFNSYLTLELSKTSSEAGKNGFLKLRRFLSNTWSSIDAQSGIGAIPDWVRVLRQESQLLSENPVDKYAADFLVGQTEHVQIIANELGIPVNSWFWQELVLGAVLHAVKGSDDAFKSQILMLIELIKYSPVYRDKAITQILIRYYQCANKIVHPELRDYVVQANIWKNPKLKSAGIATAWNQVPEPVWRMVMGWVNERNLKDFFDILASRNNSDHGRLKFWSSYLEQISWTRLVLGKETINQINRNKAIQKLLETEEGVSAKLNSDYDLDAFLMQISDYIFVEFSKTGNGAYLYKCKDLNFNLHAKYYNGDTGDLKYGYYTDRAFHQIRHPDGWEDDARTRLASLGIFPDPQSKRVYQERNFLTTEQEKILGKITNLVAHEHTAPDLFNNDSIQRTTIAKPTTRISSITNVAPSTADLAPMPQDASIYTHIETPITSPEINTFSNPVNISIPTELDLDKIKELISTYPDVKLLDTRFEKKGHVSVKDVNENAQLAKTLESLGFEWWKNRRTWVWRK